MVKRSAKNVAPTWTVAAPARLDGFLRASLDLSWGKARALVETGKISVDGERVLRSDVPLREGQVVRLDERAPRPSAHRTLGDVIVYADAHVVVVRKPPGISTVPYDEGERGTLDELVARALPHAGRGPTPSLGVVHRLDKETSGLLVFTRTWLAKKSLASQFRAHTVHRRYLAIAHGDVPKRSITSYLVADRGDGLRGSQRAGDRGGEGQRATTHIEPVERLENATLVACTLETGRTHQIRIHLAELGHPVVGERVYVRNFRGPVIPAPRVMLHAAELGFVHPKTERAMRWEEKPPADFDAMLATLRNRE
jgi:23S rRNA pseudouridine1911/1915/1917 synthase